MHVFDLTCTPYEIFLYHKARQFKIRTFLVGEERFVEGRWKGYCSENFIIDFYNFSFYFVMEIQSYRLLLKGPPNTFFLENALKINTEYFLKFLFLFESTILPVNNGK